MSILAVVMSTVGGPSIVTERNEMGHTNIAIEAKQQSRSQCRDLARARQNTVLSVDDGTPTAVTLIP